MTSTPLVSISMTAYNREAYIAEAIESVLATTYPNWELIIVDDCSTDHTFEIVTKYARADARISVYRNEQNLGDYKNRNRAAAEAKGEYIVTVDSDDWMIADSLSKWVSTMQEKEASFGIFARSEYNSPILLSPKEVIIKHFFETPVLSFGPIASIIKNRYFNSIQGFPTKYGPANDMYYNLKAGSQTNTVLFPYPLVNYRIHEGQELNNKYSYLYNNFRYLRDALNELNLPLSVKEKQYLLKKNKRRFFVNVIKFLVKTGDVKRAGEAIRLAEFGLKDAAVAVFQ